MVKLDKEFLEVISALCTKWENFSGHENEDVARWFVKENFIAKIKKFYDFADLGSYVYSAPWEDEISSIITNSLKSYQDSAEKETVTLGEYVCNAIGRGFDLIEIRKFNENVDLLYMRYLYNKDAEKKEAAQKELLEKICGNYEGRNSVYAAFSEKIRETADECIKSYADSEEKKNDPISCFSHYVSRAISRAVRTGMKDLFDSIEKLYADWESAENAEQKEAAKSKLVEKLTEFAVWSIGKAKVSDYAAVIAETASECLESFKDSEEKAQNKQFWNYVTSATGKKLKSEN